MSLTPRSNPSLVPHTQHGHHVTTSRRYRWLMFKQNLRGVGFALGRLALVALLVGTAVGCIVLSGYLLALGWRLAR